MSATVRNLYANGFTAQGFYSLSASIMESLDHVFIIKGAPGTGKSLLVKEIANALLKQGFNLEMIHSPQGSEALDGMIVPSKRLGLMISSFPFTIEPNYPSQVEMVINLDENLTGDVLSSYTDKINSLTNNLRERYYQAVHHLSLAKEIHLEREAIYIQHMDFEKANEVTQSLITSIFSNHKSDHSSTEVRHLFLGATTSKGVINYIDNLTEMAQRRIIIKGRAGSGKSTILNKLIKEAQVRGYTTEIFKCGFDPSSLDMVIIPKLGSAILDGTAPHPIEASRSGDEIVDMYELCFTKDVDHDLAIELQGVVERYKEQISAAISELQEAEFQLLELKKIYSTALDAEKHGRTKQELLKNVLAICST